MRRAIGSNFAKEIQHTLSYARRRQAKTALTMKLTKALLLILPLALTTSCMVGPNYRTPDAKVEQQWTYGSGASARQTKQGNASWWKTFKDPVLNNLIEVAYRNNPTQQIAGCQYLAGPCAAQRDDRQSFSSTAGAVRRPELHQGEHA